MQGKDNLEKFVAENREAFDDKVLSKDVWSSIDQELKTSIAPKTVWYWKAAVVVLLGAVSFLLVDKYSVEKQTLADIESLEISNVDKFQDLESFYTSIISKKQVKLNQQLADNQSVYNYVETDLEELNELYDDLKELFLESQPSDELLDRLLHLLRQKIHLINSQLDIIGTEKAPASMTEPDYSI